jgi:hypothetical protein
MIGLVPLFHRRESVSIGETARAFNRRHAPQVGQLDFTDHYPGAHARHCNWPGGGMIGLRQDYPRLRRITQDYD